MDYQSLFFYISMAITNIIVTMAINANYNNLEMSPKKAQLKRKNGKILKNKFTKKMIYF